MKQKPTRSQIIFGILSIAVMVIIFMFSREDAEDSSETSGFFTTILLRLLYRDYDSFTPEHQAELHDLLSHIVRKAAHFTVYTALGFCTSFTAGKRRLISQKSLAVMGISSCTPAPTSCTSILSRGAPVDSPTSSSTPAAASQDC